MAHLARDALPIKQVVAVAGLHVLKILSLDLDLQESSSSKALPRESLGESSTGKPLLPNLCNLPLSWQGTPATLAFFAQPLNHFNHLESPMTTVAPKTLGLRIITSALHVFCKPSHVTSSSRTGCSLGATQTSSSAALASQSANDSTHHSLGVTSRSCLPSFGSLFLAFHTTERAEHKVVRNPVCARVTPAGQANS